MASIFVPLAKIRNSQPQYTFSLADGAVPALSPDRKLIAYSNGTEVGLFDVAQRTVVAQQAIPEKLQWPFLAFSPSGRSLGCVAFDKIADIGPIAFDDRGPEMT